MKRGKGLMLHDAINCSVSKGFTQIPNDMLHNPNISGKAKALLCLLLSNKKGWQSHAITLKKFMKEKGSALQSGLQELEELGYLLRLRYRDITTKTYQGSFWAYTDVPGKFMLEEHITTLEQYGFETIVKVKKPYPDYPDVGFPDVDYPDMENRALIIPNNNNIKRNKTTSSSSDSSLNKITPRLFEQFWELYPKKADKGKALTAWNKICQRKTIPAPTWGMIKDAIQKQKQSERWQNHNFIPMPTTWLNQSRWFDDPKEMKGSRLDANKPDKIIEYGEAWYLRANGHYYNATGERYS